MENHPQSFDVCIVCALPEEARAFLEVLQQACEGTIEEQISLRYHSSYRFATLKNDKGESLNLHVSWLPRYGPQEMILHLSHVLEESQPRIAIMTGICAGDARHLRLGDLVVAERTFTYDNGKFALDDDGRRVHLQDTMTYQLDANTLQFLGLFDNWRPLVARLKRPPSSPEQRKRRMITCHIKPMASGSAVRADHPFGDVQAPVRGTVAIDMEGAAFGLVMSRHPQISWLVVKSVCDYADRAKSDAYHDYAARASALYALSFIQKYVISERMPLVDKGTAISKENRWKQVLEALALLVELTAKHIDAINLVVAPIVENNDLMSTFQNYRALVNNDYFPIGYGTARGILEGAYGVKEFQKEPTHQKLKDVLLKLYEFQSIAFLLKRSSWRMADEFEKAEELWSLLSGKNSSRASSETIRLRNVVSQAFRSDMNAMSSPELADDHKLDTPDEVVELVRIWCKVWQRSCQQTLYGGRGLHYAIGQLKVERY